MRWREAQQWYTTKGHHLASIPVATDAALREKLQDIATDALVVRLYVIGPASPGACILLAS